MNEDRRTTYEPNTRHWQVGDVVIHDADAKRPEMLMVVVAYQPSTGLVVTRYRDIRSVRAVCEGFESRGFYRNEPRFLHDPARFGIEK